jgi:hypothetical protein
MAITRLFIGFEPLGSELYGEFPKRGIFNVRRDDTELPTSIELIVIPRANKIEESNQ